MIHTTESNATNTALAIGIAVVGGLLLTYIYDKYNRSSEEDSDAWLAKKRRSGYTKIAETGATTKITATDNGTSISSVNNSNGIAESRGQTLGGSIKENIKEKAENIVEKAENIKDNIKGKAENFVSEAKSTVNSNLGKVPVPPVSTSANTQQRKTVIEETEVRQYEATIPTFNAEERVKESITSTSTIGQEVPALIPVESRMEGEQQIYVVEAEGIVKQKEREAVVQERIHPVEVEEIQPVIHRERKFTEVHQITQPIYEEMMREPIEQKRELIPEHRATVYESREAYAKEFEKGIVTGSTEYDQVKKITVVKPAIIEEIIKRDIVEVIQPVIHREIIEPTVIHTTKPIYEKIKETPTVVHETREAIVMNTEQIEALSASTTEDLKGKLMETIKEVEALSSGNVETGFEKVRVTEEVHRTTEVLTK